MDGRPWNYTVLHCSFPLWYRIGDMVLSTAQHLQETSGKTFLEKYQCLSSRGALPPSQGQSVYALLASWAFWVGFGYLEGSFDSQHFRASLYPLWCQKQRDSDWAVGTIGLTWTWASLHSGSGLLDCVTFDRRHLIPIKTWRTFSFSFKDPERV